MPHTTRAPVTASALAPRAGAAGSLVRTWRHSTCIKALHLQTA